VTVKQRGRRRQNLEGHEDLRSVEQLTVLYLALVFTVRHTLWFTAMTVFVPSPVG